MNDDAELIFTFAEEAPGRLDRVIAAFLANDPERRSVTRSQIKHWIEDGHVRVQGEIATKAGTEVRPGYVVTIAVGHVRTSESPLRPYDVDLDILFEDDDLIVIDKQAGLSMHPGAGNQHETLANAIVSRLSPIDRKELDSSRPGIVHRLDRDTTGIVVVAKKASVHADLSRQFAERTVRRLYRALVVSFPRAEREIDRAESGVIEARIGRHPTKKTEMAVLPTGREAITKWRLVKRVPYAALIDLRLQTGRTHQIRVHLAHVGSPVIGDVVYGSSTELPLKLRLAADGFGRQALHARTLEFVHPGTGKSMRFDRDPPADFLKLIATFEEFEG